MRGTPSKIQTPQDLRNLFDLWKDGYEGIDKARLIEMVRALCGQRFFNLPIVKTNGDVVTVRYFYEGAVGGETEDGLAITDVNHYTPPEDVIEGEEDEGFTLTDLTLSEALPEGSKFLRVYNSCNCVDARGFDMDEINNILGVLANA